MSSYSLALHLKKKYWTHEQPLFADVLMVEFIKSELDDILMEAAVKVGGREVEAWCPTCQVEAYGHTTYIVGETGNVHCSFCKTPVVTREWYEKHCIAKRLQLRRRFSDAWLHVKMFVLHQYTRIQQRCIGKRKKANDQGQLDSGSKSN